MMDTATRIGTELEFAATENLVKKMAWNYAKMFKADYGELYSVACQAWCEAYQDYDAEKAALTTHIYHRVRGALLSWRRSAAQHYTQQKCIDPVKLANTPQADTRRTWSVLSLLAEVSEDAEVVLLLVVDTPNDLELLGLTPAKIRVNLRRYLRESLGWTAKRIVETFDEIRAVLS